MKERFNDKRVIVIDRGGMFCSWAHRLAREFGEVYYHNPAWKSLSPRSNELLIGHGYDDITMVKDMWKVVHQMDLIVVPFIFDGDLQEELQRQGKRVWGARRGDEFEIYRPEAKDEMAKLGMPVGPYTVVRGITNLRKYLQKNPNVHVKISVTRGDGETFHSPSYDEVLPRLREMEHELDEASESMQFVVEKAIDPALEVGYDGWFCDGFPPFAINGVECKDESYLGAFLEYDELDEHVRDVNRMLEPMLRSYGYRGFMSTEIRVGEDEQPYLIDFTARSASPAGEAMQEMIVNWAPIMWHGAEGKIVRPEAEKKYSAQAVIHSEHADEGWQAVKINDDAARRWIKLFFACHKNGMDYVMPQHAKFNEIGWVVGLGDTVKEAIKNCEDHAAEISGYKLEVRTKALQDAVEEIEKGEALGVRFSDEKMKA